jgi:hypothetical protein
LGPGACDEDAIAADAFVQDGKIGCGWVVVQAEGEVVRPAMVLVFGGIGPVGDGVAVGNDGGGLRRDRLYVYALEEIPG